MAFRFGKRSLEASEANSSVWWTGRKRASSSWRAVWGGAPKSICGSGWQLKESVKKTLLARLMATILLGCTLVLVGCEGSDDISVLFEGDTTDTDKDTEFIEVPPENDLSIEITDPSEDGTTIGYERSISGTCGTVGLLVQVDGDIETFGVCGVDLTWSVDLDASSVGIGTVSVNVRLVDDETLGNAKTRTFSKVSTACDTESARNDTFANFSTTGAPPWQICTPTQLSNIGTTYQGDDIELMNDLDFNGGTLGPMGDTTTGFTGTFEGNGFTIYNLVINDPNSDQVGIFREAGGATFQNINFESVIVRGDNDIGLLVGRVDNNDVTIQNVHVSYIELEATTTGNDGVLGGLVGRLDTNSYNFTMNNVSVTGITITSNKGQQGGVIGYIEPLTGTVDIDDVRVVGGEIQGRSHVGGIIGRMHENLDPANTTVDNVLNTANVAASSGYGGGITGYAVGLFTNVGNTGNVTRTGGEYFGGIAGYFRNGTLSGTSAAATRDSSNQAPDVPTAAAPTVDSNGDVVSCYNSGSVLGGNGNRTGGLIGFTYRTFDGMTSCYNTGKVTGGNQYVGGLIGYGETAVIHDSFNTGDVTGEGTNIGGIAGRIQNNTTNSSITNTYASGKVTTNSAAPNRIAGGVGDWEGSGGMTDVWFNGEIESLNGDDSAAIERIAGLVGSWDNSGSSCVRCDTEGTLTVSITASSAFTHRYIAGLVGYNGSDISDSSSAMVIVAEEAQDVGGLVGYDNRRTISNSFATGDVTGRNNVGGLVGQVRDQNCSINDSYATGNVVATRGGGNNAFAGGLMGAGGAAVLRSYATGNVTAIDGNYVGGFEGGRGDNWNRVVAESFATGNVDAGSGQYVGGFSGRARIRANNYVDNFATGNVRGGENVGGFMGSLRRQGANALRRNYAIGQVVKATGASGADSSFGPMYGEITNGNDGVDSSSNFYNSDFLPIHESSGLTLTGFNTINVNGLSTAVMTDALNFDTNYVNFDFTSTPVWAAPSSGLILPGHSVVYQYPVPEWVE